MINLKTFRKTPGINRFELFTRSFYPESFDYNYAKGRSSDLLSLWWPSHSFVRNSGIKVTTKCLKELTAAGTVPEFHGIPYYDCAFDGKLSSPVAAAKVGNFFVKDYAFMGNG